MTRPCNRENMQLWIDGLLSGEFPQDQGYLKVTIEGQARYCCLGVACEIAIRNGVHVTQFARERPRCGCGCNSETPTVFDGFSTCLPPAVASWLGLPEEDESADLLSEGKTIGAIQANDSLGWDFPKIAEGLRAMYLDGGEDDTPTAG